MPLPYGLEQIDKWLAMGSPEHEILARLLDTVGDGSGTKDMAGAANVYFIQPPAGEIYLIRNIVLTISDDAGFDADGWGGLAALANGCKFEIRRKEGASPAVVVRDLTDGVVLKEHAQLGRYGSLSLAVDAGGGCVVQAMFEYLPVIRLDGDRKEQLVFQVQDSLANLVTQEMMVLGLRCQGKNV